MTRLKDFPLTTPLPEDMLRSAALTIAGRVAQDSTVSHGEQLSQLTELLSMLGLLADVVE